MADKSISELVAATAVGSTDLFVLEQTGTAKKLTGQILENWLVSFADGHGGIHTFEKTGTSGLVDTYTITYADTTTSTITVTNGKSISSITQYWAVSESSSTVPSLWHTTRQTMTVTNKYLWSYMHYAYNDGTSYDTPYSVIGVYGDTGAQTYVWIKYAGIRPTSDADMGDTPDKWIGIYFGLSGTAPTSYTEYDWYQYKGEKGDTGDPSEVTAHSVTYLEGTSGTVVPEGSWTTTVPSVTPGNFLWTRTQLTFNYDTSLTSYSVSRFGIDGTGSVSSVNTISPDTNGNVSLTAANIPMTDDNISAQVRIVNAEADIDDLTEVLDKAVLQAAVRTISGNGTTSDIALTGLTANHVVANWGMFSDAACTTPIPGNSPTCDITITTASNAWSVTIANFSATFYLRPTFILKQN